MDKYCLAIRLRHTHSERLVVYDISATELDAYPIIYNRNYQQIGLLGAGIVALFQLVGLNKLFGLLPLAYGSQVPQLTCIWMSRS